MNLALFLPDWDSIDSVRRAHSDLELASIVSFALLALFDILAHMLEDKKRAARILERVGLAFFAIAVAAELGGYEYGQRNDELSENVIRSLDGLAKDAEAKASNAVSYSGTASIQAGTAMQMADAVSRTAKRASEVSEEAVSKSDTALESADNALARAEDARKEVVKAEADTERVEEKYAPRTLSAAKREMFIKILQRAKSKPPTGVQIRYTVSATDGGSYAKQLADAINDPSTGWRAYVGLSPVVGDDENAGIVIAVHSDADHPAWVDELRNAMQMSGIEILGAHDERLKNDEGYIEVMKKN